MVDASVKSGSHSSQAFLNQKKQCVAGVDLSRKGSIDAPIVHLVNFINAQSNYFTTSSCSGRIVLHQEETGQKEGCSWLFLTHEECTVDELIQAVGQAKGNAFFKFEAFVLHTQCQSVADAQMMLAQAVASGFRNSGISVSKSGKIITAVRSTHSLEVPLTRDGQLLVPEKYLEYLVEVANQKMGENIKRINRFYDNFKQAVSSSQEKKKMKPVKSTSSYCAQQKKEEKTSEIFDEKDGGLCDMLTLFEAEEAAETDIHGLSLDER